MRTSLKLKQKRNEKVAAAQAILDAAPAGAMSSEQRTAFDAIEGEIKTLNGDIERAEGIEALQVDAATMDAGDRRPSTQVGDGAAPAGTPSEIEIVSRYGSPKLFKGPNAAQRAYQAGMWILASIFGREDAKEYCKKNGVGLVWVDKNFNPVQNVSQERTNTGGGFLVPSVLESIIIDLRESYGLFRQWARVVPMASDVSNIPRRKGGLTAYPIGESVAPTETTKSWNQVNLVARKWGVLTRYSSELAEDAIINVAEDLASEIAYAFAFAEDDAGFNGDGSGAYHGIQGVVTKFNNQVSAGASTFKGALDAASGHDTFAEIDNTDLTNLMALLPKYAEANAGWTCSQTAWAAVFQRLAAAAGGNTRDTLTGGKLRPMYLGYPVNITQSMPTTTGDLSDKAMILFGDMRSAITMGTRRGVTLAVSEHAYFTTDEIGIRGTERFDIVVNDIGDTSTAGPLVALIGE